jgi:farnesyl-diphosphate farnesyltransferase
MNDLLIKSKIFTEPMSYCNYILPHVSRSFALGINTLKGKLRNNILIGYLLCRIADTIEDDLSMSPEKKSSYLLEFLNCFPNREKISHFSQIALELNGDPYHINLVQNSNLVFDIFATLTKNSQSILEKWVREMTLGMVKYIQKYPKGIRISNLAEYKEYCYYVAGTVGYMLTDLWKECGYFINDKRHAILNQWSGIFGEGLQTINILKDITWDIEHENSIFIPKDNFSEESIQEIVQLAEDDLKASLSYVENIPIINRSIRFFCLFPLFLAIATLREIKNSPSILNPENKIKVNRIETKQIYKSAFIASFSNKMLRKKAELLF